MRDGGQDDTKKRWGTATDKKLNELNLTTDNIKSTICFFQIDANLAEPFGSVLFEKINHKTNRVCLTLSFYPSEK